MQNVAGALMLELMMYNEIRMLMFNVCMCML